MEFLDNKTIKLDRELSELDKFTLDFIKILKKYTNYVIISGYVSIILGRARASEDIDIIIPKLNSHKFEELTSELKKENYYCLNTNEDKDMFDYITNKVAIRFAKQNTVIPNIELKFAKNKSDLIALEKTITIKTNNQEIIISNLELQIAFKEKILKSPKDLEDARHIRNIAKDYLDLELIKKYEVLLNEF
ncbi:hypothetical protein CL616_02920 [archaeon]|nr:hypothetical protein [archaeon]|tara:strand:- start:148 stop:720 length:573 start_codon:yes stop_codon:yes gene_type:complete